ncbi:MAG TPA: lysophospholipid acyltransferase family protein [Nevskia sp.]|nr:lysophospholipid acyltransferase family protein [Nevskia sp.]
MPTTLLRWTLFALGQLPLPLLHGLGWLLGSLLWLVPNGMRAVTRRHLELCFPERSAAERARIGRRSMIESGKAVCESPALWFGSERRLRRWIGDAAALRTLQTAVAGGRGAVMLTPHLGAWEIASFFCAQAGPITVLYKPQKGAFEALILRGRSRLGVRPVPTSSGGVKALLGALRRGELVGLLPDHDPPDESGTRFAPLFGVPANTMDLAGRLAARGAPAWFVMAERLSWGRGYRFHLQRAPAGIDDPENGAAALNQGVEACVTRFPEQYWWSYKRYRRRPPGAADPYMNL